LPLAEMWEELQARVEQLAGEAGRKILHGILEDEVARRVGPLQRRSRSTTNRIESCLGTVRHLARNVKRGQGGDYYLARWTTSGLLEVEKKSGR
jgi:hypothetical protein